MDEQLVALMDIAQRRELPEMHDVEFEHGMMLDQLEMACRQYQQIAPNAGATMTLGQADQLTDWLEHQVGEIVASLLERPGFRRRVRWPIERLTGESNCPERQAVLAVENGLLRYAEALLAVTQSDEMLYQLSRLGRYLGTVSEDDQAASDPALQVGESSYGQQSVEFVASRPWRDLASAWDYFHPASQFNLKDPDHAQWGEFLPFVNRQLRVPGDFVMRCLEIRVKTWQAELQKFWVRCDTARQNGEVDIGTRWDDLNRISSDFNECFQSLRALCCSGQEARVRDSCIALLQIYVGFHQDADLSWLGPVAKMVVNVSDLPYRVSHRHEWAIPERAATALVDIAELVRRPQAPEDVVEEMKATHRLVLIEDQREGFFNGQSIDRSDETKWHGASPHWEMLWTLADRARLKKSVDCYCLSNTRTTKEKQPPSHQAVKDRRSELKKLIVSELNDLILDAGPGTYRLALEPDEICLLGWFQEERLEVLPPTAPRISDA